MISELASAPKAHAGGNGQMPGTLWTLVLTARQLQAPEAQAALAKLCEIYWYPLYVFVRRHGHTHHAAQDLTQGFFEHLLAPHSLNGVDRQKGKFRSFLLSALEHFLVNEHLKQNTLKRGGGVEIVSWDAEVAESRHSQQPSLESNPEREFERLWACALVEKALARLKTEYSRCGKTELFAAFSPFMTRPVPRGHYAEAATRLRTTEGALRIGMHRFLQRFGELLRTEVANTIADPAEVDSELREVLKAWAAAR